MQLPSSSEDDESEIQDQQTEIAVDGTIWKKIEEGDVAGTRTYSTCEKKYYEGGAK